MKNLIFDISFALIIAFGFVNQTIYSQDVIKQIPDASKEQKAKSDSDSVQIKRVLEEFISENQKKKELTEETKDITKVQEDNFAIQQKNHQKVKHTYYLAKKTLNMYQQKESKMPMLFVVQPVKKKVEVEVNLKPPMRDSLHVPHQKRSLINKIFHPFRGNK